LPALARAVKQPKPKPALLKPGRCTPEVHKLVDFVHPSMLKLLSRSSNIDSAASSLPSYTTDNEQLQRHFVRKVAFAYKAEAAGYLTCAGGDFVALASNKASDGDEGCLFCKYIFAWRLGDEMSGWLPEDILVNP